jgi:AcrR family transcriptional regulator
MNAMSSEKRKYELKARAESQQRTRERIVEATVELHQEVGPAQTTIAEIARRAGVQRLTVYNHFPDETALFGACQAHWLARHPPPDVSGAFERDDPVARLEAVLCSYYSRYRETEAMSGKVQRDRATVAPLDELLRRTADPAMAGMADALDSGFPGGANPNRRALIALALEFWTWRRLTAEGITDPAAAALMARAVASAPH